MSIPSRILNFTLNKLAIPAILFGLWLALLCHFSNSVPEDMPEMIVPQQDKILHFLFFTGGAAALAATLRLLLKLRGPSLFLVVAVIIGLLGALDEYNQQFIPGRSGLNLADWVADMVGAFAGAGLLHLLAAKLKESEVKGASKPVEPR